MTHGHRYPEGFQEMMAVEVLREDDGVSTVIVPGIDGDLPPVDVPSAKLECVDWVAVTEECERCTKLSRRIPGGLFSNRKLPWDYLKSLGVCREEYVAKPEPTPPTFNEKVMVECIQQAMDPVRVLNRGNSLSGPVAIGEAAGKMYRACMREVEK